MSKDGQPEIKEVQKLIITTASSDNDSDARTKLELAQLELEREKTLLQSIRNDIEARKKYAIRIFVMVVGWLVIILAIIVFVGFGWIKLSDGVLIALITSTTVNVASFFLAVTRYLFPSSQKDI